MPEGFDEKPADQMAEEMQGSEERSWQPARAMPQIFFTCGQNGAPNYVNQEWYESLGVGKEQASGEAWWEFVHPDDRDGARRRWMESVKAGRPCEIEFRLRPPAGEYRWHLSRAVPIRGEQGEILQWIGALTDIHDRKSAETALRESQLRVSAIIASAMDAIITVDAHQRVTVFNAAAARMFGCPVEKAIGESLDRFIPERFRGAHHGHIEGFSRANATRRSMGSLGAVFGLRANGEEFPIEASISQIEADGRKFFTVILRDITHRQRAEEELRRERDRAQQYLDVVEVILVVLDKNATIREVNRKGCEVLGYDERELIGGNWFDACIPAGEREFVQAVFRRVVAGEVEQDRYIENKVLTKSGEERLIRWHNVALKDAAGHLTGTLSSGEDITEKKKLEAQFLRAQRLESIGTLASGIAHDLNNVLSPITMGVQLLQMRQNDEGARRLLDMILQNTMRGADLIKQVLSFARGGGAQKTTFQPNHLIKEIIEVLHETLPKNIAVKQMLAPHFAAIEGDPTQLHQVLMNLSVNARDAMPQGGTLTIATENILLDEHYARMLPEARPGPYVAIIVTDTGTGIPTEILDRIFDPFFTTKEPGKGTGLGLATVQGIIKNHSGFINVYSEPGKGTQFRIHLPTIASAESGPPAAALGDLPAGRGETILVVDDEAHIREITRTTLEAFGFRVLLASDGAEGVAVYAANQNEIRVVLTDMMMPSMDGAAMIRELRKINPRVQIIASSGLAEGERAADAIALGIEALLPKPYKAESLLTTLDNLIRK
ncbi:MAG: PAS domain S-box protein [Blastocatellia bacterium]